VRATVITTLLFAKLVTADDVVTIPLTTIREQFVCVHPADVLCAADDEDERTRCTPCQKWGTRQVPQTRTVRVDLTKYRHGRGFGIPRANFFLRDVSEQLYDRPFPTTAAGYPITIDELHAHPDRYGWTVVEPSLTKVGTIALDDEIGGLVIAENASAMTTDQVRRLLDVTETTDSFVSYKDTGIPGMFVGYAGTTFPVPTIDYPRTQATAGSLVGTSVTNIHGSLVGASTTAANIPRSVIGTSDTTQSTLRRTSNTEASMPMATAAMTVHSRTDRIPWNPVTSSAVMLYPSDEHQGVITPDATGEVLKKNRKNVAPKEGVGGQQTIIERQEDDASLYWNAWPELKTVLPTFKPAHHLQPETEYTLFIDLSGMGYNIVPGRAASRNVAELAREWILRDDEPEVTLSAFILADAKLFTLLGKSDRVLRIDLKKVRDWFDPTKRRIDIDPAAVLDAEKKPFFTFGRLPLSFVTHKAEGIGSVSLSFWDEDGRPVDELSIPLCVATPNRAAQACAGMPSMSEGFTGVDSIRTAKNGGRPTAALHFLDTLTGEVFGIFRRNDVPSDFVYWPTKKKADDLIGKLNGIMNMFAERKTEEEFATLGNQLYDLLFPDPQANPDPRIRIAREAFEEFIARYMDRPPAAVAAAVGEVPSLFVRVIRDPASIPRVIPFGLLRPTRSKPDFVGYYFRIENPLDIQNYDVADNCIARWFLVIPPAASTELKDVRALFDKRFGPWSAAAQQVFERMRPETKKRPKNAPMTFYEWINSGEEQEDAALVVLSHHGVKDDFGRLTFGQDAAGTDDDYIASNEIKRRFHRPAVAILNGCGTTKPGAEDVMTELNKNNVQAIIATKHTVQAAMAVDFFTCLNESLERSQRTPSLMGHTYFETIRCLRDRGPETIPRTNTKWGARSLAYSLLGNANLRLCSPTKEARQ
jgi:hypothetical protein